ncbi:hypothetical protein IAU59_001139 [Kwoniella sp. CBS 9459]
MSFYFNHPYFTATAAAPGAPHPHRRGFGFATPHPAQAYYAPSYPAAARSSPSPHVTFEHDNVGDNVGDNDYISLEEEERAAQAHLRSIQRRREEAHAAAIAREAAIRAEVEAQARAARARAQAEAQAAQARARAEREAAIRAETVSRIEREAQIQAALNARRTEEERRKRAYIEAVERRRAEYLAAQRQREAIQDVQRRACQQRCQRRLVAPPSSLTPARAASPCACPCQRQQADPCCAADDRSARPAPARAQTPSHQAEWQDFNNMLGSLFGFQLVPDTEADTDTDTKQNKETESQTRTDSTTNAPAPAPTPAPAPVAEASSPAEQTEAKADAGTEARTESLPENFNDLLSQFLGLRVDPLRESESSSSIDRAKENGNGVPAGLNEFLSRFGLVFEPDQPEENKGETSYAPAAEPAKSAPAFTSSEKKDERAPSPAPAPPAASASSAPAETHQQQDVPPFTSLLNQFTEINPFVRDILGNLEQAFTEELRQKNGDEKQQQQAPQPERCERRCENQCKRTCARKDKGKGRAEGERKEIPRPTPAPAPTAAQPTEAATPASADTATTTETTDSSKSISALDSIESQLSELQSSFTFPSRLAFAHTAPGESAPALLFNKVNSPYHAQAHALLQLLLKADSVTSNGDKEVRQRRKQVVRAVEQEIENLEKKRDGLWELVKEKRERGEESEPEDDGRSWTESSSSVGDHEHLEQDQEIEHVEHVEKQPAETEAPSNKDESADQDKSYADATKSVEPQTEQEVAEKKPDQEPAQAEPTESTQQPSDSHTAEAESAPQGYTIGVTFPAEGVKDQGEEVEKTSDHSAKVEDEEETKEEGYEVI